MYKEMITDESLTALNKVEKKWIPLPIEVVRALLCGKGFLLLIELDKTNGGVLTFEIDGTIISDPIQNICILLDTSEIYSCLCLVPLDEKMECEIVMLGGSCGILTLSVDSRKVCHSSYSGNSGNIDAFDGESTVAKLFELCENNNLRIGYSSARQNCSDNERSVEISGGIAFGLNVTDDILGDFESEITSTLTPRSVFNIQNTSSIFHYFSAPIIVSSILYLFI